MKSYEMVLLIEFAMDGLKTKWQINIQIDKEKERDTKESLYFWSKKCVDMRS